MRPLFSTTLALLSILPPTFSQQLSFLPPTHSPGCRHVPLTSGDYIYFTSPNESSFQFSIYTEWDRWYPNILRIALLQAGFSLETLRGKNQTDNCGWTDVETVKVGGWNRGHVRFKELAVSAPQPRPASQHPAPQPSPKMNHSAAHVPRLEASQPTRDPIKYWISHPAAGSLPPPHTNRAVHIPRKAAPQPFRRPPATKPKPTHPTASRTPLAMVPPGPLYPTILPISRRAAPAQPAHRPQQQTLEQIRTILLTNSPEADIALFLVQVVVPVIATVLLIYLLLIVGRSLGRLCYPAPNPEEEDGNIELSSLNGKNVEHGSPFTDPMKPELARVVPRGDERFYTAKTKVNVPRDERFYAAKTKANVPRSSSVYSRSVDGTTLYGGQ